jgi:hypothetical protein
VSKKPGAVQVCLALKVDCHESAEKKELAKMNSLTTEIKKVLADAAALEREPVRPGEDPSADRAERRYRIQARFTALLVEACAPGYAGTDVTTEASTFILVPQEDRKALREAREEQDRLLSEWWRQHFGDEIIAYSLLDAMLSGVWTFAGWPSDMIEGPSPGTFPNI